MAIFHYYLKFSKILLDPSDSEVIESCEESNRVIHNLRVKFLTNADYVQPSLIPEKPVIAVKKESVFSKRINALIKFCENREYRMIIDPSNNSIRILKGNILIKSYDLYREDICNTSGILGINKSSAYNEQSEETIRKYTRCEVPIDKYIPFQPYCLPVNHNKIFTSLKISNQGTYQVLAFEKYYIAYAKYEGIDIPILAISRKDYSLVFNWRKYKAQIWDFTQFL